MPTSAPSQRKNPKSKNSFSFLAFPPQRKERAKLFRDREKETLFKPFYYRKYLERNHIFSKSSSQTTMSLRIATSRALRSASTANVTRSFSSLDRAQTVETYNAVLQKFADIRACAVLRTATSEACPKAMQAAIDGGFKIVEFTLTTPGCLDHLADFRKKYDGDVMVGCGTILTVEDAEKAMDAGGTLIRYMLHLFMSLG